MEARMVVQRHKMHEVHVTMCSLHVIVLVSASVAADARAGCCSGCAVHLHNNCVIPACVNQRLQGNIYTSVRQYSETADTYGKLLVYITPSCQAMPTFHVR